MNIELIAIGDEVLYGMVVNSNAAFISQALFEAGFVVSRHSTVGDDPVALRKALHAALLRKSCVITTGGLGPTCDDHTRVALAEIFNVPLKHNSEVHAYIKSIFGNTKCIDNQATVPVGAEILSNPLGTASGLYLRNETLYPESFLIALPGVPSEMKEMVKTQLIPYLNAKLPVGKRLFVLPLHFMKLCEVDVDHHLHEIEKEFPEINCGIYPGMGVLSVHLKAMAQDEEEFLQIVQTAKDKLSDKFRVHLFDSPSGRLDEAVHLYFLEKKISFALAESCTGGSLAGRFCAYSGASSYFKGSIVAYANEVKKALLHVSEKTLESKGAVSIEVTEEMAKNVAKAMSARCSVAVSGILGPTGGTDDKPVGTICASIYLEGHPLHSWQMKFTGNREIILEKTIQNILAELLTFLFKNVAN